MTPAQPAIAPSDRVRLRRKRERGSHDREVIDAILDEGLIAHLGVTDDEGHPVVTPTLHARVGDVVYLHGSAASRTLASLRSGGPACLTVSLIDGLVLARSAMHHSVNYRSVMLFGRSTPVTDPEEKLKALEAVVEHIIPGRWAAVRAPTENELRATAVLSMPIDQASAKVRSGQPVDDEDDYAIDTWAGVLPLALQPLAPQPDPRMPAARPLPSYVSCYRRPR
ncbi:MAG TPA: pyridoxamine 5'-phosphate oxidase family protein [Solirubrobacteraceae bacterium]|jgi:hypothetical protein